MRLEAARFIEPPADSSRSVTGDAARGADAMRSSGDGCRWVFLAGLLGNLGLSMPRPSASKRSACEQARTACDTRQRESTADSMRPVR